MGDVRVELEEIDLPDFGSPSRLPEIERAEYENRLQRIWEKADGRGLDAILVYGDREHSANIAFLSGYDPRFEEALLVLTPASPPILLVGNEGWGYTRVSPLKLELRLYQNFSLMGQDRSRSESLEKILRDAALRSGSKVGIIDWKYFGPDVGPDHKLWINAPAYLVDTVRKIAGISPVNASDLLMNPRDGMRSINSVDQLAVFEFAGASVCNSMRRVLRGLRPGMTEFEAVEEARLNWLPLSCHPMFVTGDRVHLGLASPSGRLMEAGDPAMCALGIRGALSARAGFLVHDEGELPPGIADYVDRLVKPYFAAIVDWYQHMGLEVRGAELHQVIQGHLGDPFFGVGLNPGHSVHLEEWVNSPIYPGSDIEMCSGMALQVDVIPSTQGPYFTTNIEDTIALADASLRQSLATRWPEAWSRIQARRTFMREALGIQLKPEVLPLSNLAAHLTPYMLEPNKALRVAG